MCVHVKVGEKIEERREEERRGEKRGGEGRGEERRGEERGEYNLLEVFQPQVCISPVSSELPLDFWGST